MGNNPFNTTRYDLGVDIYSSPSAKEDIDGSFRQTEAYPENICVYCGGTPMYKLVAKLPQLDTELLRKQGYICGGCATTGKANPNEYGLKILK